MSQRDGMINLFKKDPVKAEPLACCVTCEVYFRARKYDTQFGAYCETHAQPLRALEARKAVVRKYAVAKWEELEPKAKKWNVTRAEAVRDMQKAYW